LSIRAGIAANAGIFSPVSGSTRCGRLQMIWTRTLLAIVTIAAPGVSGEQNKRARSTADGLRVFQHCSGCHSAETSETKVGPSLKGLFRKRALLNGMPANERTIRLKIKDGGGGMPSYGQALSAKELQQLIEYLRSL
jgi:mono/diheme cytochrome c family protein